ncbi:hypothetical protein BFW38_02390 [Terasakiispira papahanaumokuakeensis]|uniref:Uncharacterized protein n=1 Tax=Terasakiispira papahanaumokuakeensis TaxID=197479 RepID=A0A1E2V7D5_9GAMM|nr:hypothetical protein [Terasakiispira papahanaumokuakeensis]ODC02565.1 hypothetical protein BFW38_02390 [Terasakiispira papahanaumokuakeensis]
MTTAPSTQAYGVRKPAVSPLRFHHRKSYPLHQLPFIDKAPGKRWLSFWAVPKTGGYSGGCKTGESLARIYLKHLKKHRTDFNEGRLQSIVLDMCEVERGGDPEQGALCGQVVGFFSELECWLIAAVQHLDGGLDQDENKTLLKTANAGLNFDNEAGTSTSIAEDKGA